MINYQPVKILFSVGGIEIRSYGVALVLAFIVGFFITKREVKRQGLDTNEFINMFVLIVLGAIIGARLFFVAEYIQHYSIQPSAILKTWKGGVSSYGGFIGAFLFTFIYTKLHKTDIWNYVDAIIPGVCAGVFITRIGCFLNWDDYGIANNLPWAVNAGDFPRHPTQLYLAINGLILFFVFFRSRIKHEDSIKHFLLFVISFNSIRFFIEFSRDEPRHFLNLTLAQITGFVIILITLFYLKRKTPPLIKHNSF